MEHEHDTTAPVETVTLPVPEPVPVVVAAPEPNHPIARLPRYNHGLLGQSLVGSRMIEHADGEWVRRADVLKLL